LIEHTFLRAGLVITALLSFSTSAALAQNQAATGQPVKQAGGQAQAAAGAGQPAVGSQTVQSSPSAGSSSIVTSDGLRPEPGLYNKPCNCQASLPAQNPAAPPAKKKHKILKGLGKELSIGMGDLGKDLVLALSVQGNDPYEMPENPNIPYIAAEAHFVDGSSCAVYRFPDRSLRIKGSYLDGTYACLQPDGLYIVQYSNGARGTMKITGEGCEVIRPDNTVTTVERKGSGSALRVSNNKLGYMGDVNKDETGLNYEFAKQNF
jgi:hypothetical protein